MSQAVNPQPDPPPAATSPGMDGAKRARRARLGDNPMQTVLGAAVVGLLIFSLTSNSSRISRLEDAVNAGFATQNAQFEARFAEIDARLDALEDRIDELELKLTALIAALNKTEEVDAAIEGRLMAPATAGPSP